jgi:hypothetical protein
MNVLLKLAERCEQATGPDRELDAAAHTATTGFEPRIGGIGWAKGELVVPLCPGWGPLPRYTASLDAAMTLVPEGWLWARDIDCIFCLYPPESTSPEIGFHSERAALALCAAALRARAAQ